MTTITGPGPANRAWLEDGHSIVWTMKAPTCWATSNQRLHWAQRAETTRLWRVATRIMARHVGIPTGLDRVHITLTFHEPAGRGRTRDVHNLAPTAKAVIDGLVDHGLIPDDNDLHLTGPDLRRGPDGPAGVTLTITKGQPA